MWFKFLMNWNSEIKLIFSFIIFLFFELNNRWLFFFFLEHDEPLTEWDYLPPVGPRPPRGFVGLKNAGATCYMNSVIQQLYMVPSIRSGILAAEGAVTDPNEDFSGDDSEVNETFIFKEPKSDDAICNWWNKKLQYCIKNWSKLVIHDWNFLAFWWSSEQSLIPAHISITLKLVYN